MIAKVRRLALPIFVSPGIGLAPMVKDSTARERRMVATAIAGVPWVKPKLSQTKTKGSERELAALWRIPSPGYLPDLSYWLSGLKVRTPASVLEQTPAGSTRTTASSSAQKPRMPVWLIDSGTATTV